MDSGEAGEVCCPFPVLALPPVCDPLSVSQQAESEMPWGWGPPAKGLTHREWLTGFPSRCHNTLRAEDWGRIRASLGWLLPQQGAPRLLLWKG